MITTEEIMCLMEAQHKGLVLVVLEEEVVAISIILTWELLTIYLGTSLVVKIHLPISSMMMMTFLMAMDLVN